MLLKLTKMPWAVSGRRYIWDAVSSVTPWYVLNIMLNFLMSVKSDFPQEGHGILLSRIYFEISSFEKASTCMDIPFSRLYSSTSLSALWRILHDLQSMSGSLKLTTWPDATQTCAFMSMAESRPTLYLLSWTNFFHQALFTLFLNSTPSGP